MDEQMLEVSKREIKSISEIFLYNVATNRWNNPFEKYTNPKCVKAEENRIRRVYFTQFGFGIVDINDENDRIVSSEAYLEGSIRVFLVNPILKKLFEMHGIVNDWQFGNTFSNFTIKNREYELSSFVEFIISDGGENIGFRYTHLGYSMSEFNNMIVDSMYQNEHKSVLGFEKLKYVDKVRAISWSGLTDEELNKVKPNLRGESEEKADISLQAFFEKYFSTEEYKYFLEICRNAIQKAREIIALKAVPQLLPNNMLQFKDTVLASCKAEFNELAYIFENGNSLIPFTGLKEEDTKILERVLIGDQRINAIIGNADFAKSYITSEYLFKTINSNLGIDYTSVVAGYLKAVEQLLYLLYISAYGTSNKLLYWDTETKCKDDADFNKLVVSNNQKYRYNPYLVSKKEEKQVKYDHKKKTGAYAPTIGALIRFIRYYPDIWNVSEDGKEYIVKCLFDYSDYCRNHHFHKDNINSSNYKMVERIRNNTLVCFCYLLGGFKLLDRSVNEVEQLKIIDYSFEHLVAAIYRRKNRLFHICTKDGYDGLAVLSRHNNINGYDETGRLYDGRLIFIKVPGETECDDIEEFDKLDDVVTTDNNSLIVTRDNLPLKLESVLRRRTKARS